jgi:hypothetical protein
MTFMAAGMKVGSLRMFKDMSSQPTTSTLLA